MDDSSEADETVMITTLLEEGVVVVLPNDGDSPDHPAALFVNCSDSFDYAAADAEPLSYAEITNLWGLYQRFDICGAIVWVARRRNRRPLPEMESHMKKVSAWPDDMDALTR